MPGLGRSSLNTLPSPAATSLNIIALGDSHTEGHVPYAIAVSDTIGVFNTPLRSAAGQIKRWNGASDDSFYPLQTTIGSVSTPNVSNDQLNSALATATAAQPSFLYAVAEQLCLGFPLTCGIVRVANCGIGGTAAYTWAGEPAVAYIGCPGTPNDGDTITVCGTTYVFRTTPAQINDVQISGTTTSLSNLKNAICAEGTGYFAGTTLNPNCFGQLQGTTYLLIYAMPVGTGGNSFTLSGSNTAGVTPLNSGLAAVASTTLTKGSAVSAAYANAKFKLAALPPSTARIVTITLGTNDASRVGYRGRTFQADYQQFITNIKTDFPGTKIIIWRPPAARDTRFTLSPTIIPGVDALVAADPTNVFSVDMTTPGLGVGNSTIVDSNGLHLTNYGYDVTAQLFAAKISNILGFTR